MRKLTQEQAKKIVNSIIDYGIHSLIADKIEELGIPFNNREEAHDEVWQQLMGDLADGLNNSAVDIIDASIKECLENFLEGDEPDNYNPEDYEDNRMWDAGYIAGLTEAKNYLS